MPYGISPAFAKYELRHHRINLSNYSKLNDKEKMLKEILLIWKYESYFGKKTPIENFGITQEQLTSWLLSNPKHTAKMLYDTLMQTRQSEIIAQTKRIRAKYKNKADQYRLLGFGFNYPKSIITTSLD